MIASLRVVIYIYEATNYLREFKMKKKLMLLSLVTGLALAGFTQQALSCSVMNSGCQEAIQGDSNDSTQEATTANTSED